MRSSDWSSDVCSSDLAFLEERKPHKNPRNSHFSLESTQASPCSCHLEKSQSAPFRTVTPRGQQGLRGALTPAQRRPCCGAKLEGGTSMGPLQQQWVW